MSINIFVETLDHPNGNCPVNIQPIRYLKLLDHFFFLSIFLTLNQINILNQYASIVEELTLAITVIR